MMDKRLSLWPEKIGAFYVPAEGWEKSLASLSSLSFGDIDRFAEKAKKTTGGAGEKGKASREGWIMFREGHVRSMEVASSAGASGSGRRFASFGHLSGRPIGFE